MASFLGARAGQAAAPQQFTAEEEAFDIATEGSLQAMAGEEYDPLFLPPPPSDEDEDYQARKRNRPKKRSASTAPSLEVDPPTAEAGPSEVKRPVKKRKGARLGRLQTMLQGLPVEILGEILSHLTPVMLLRISRTAKVFRELVLSKSSRVIWKRALKNDGIAELEAPDMSEPKLVAMIWDKECELCGRRKVHKMCYALRKRVCDTCFKLHLRTSEQILAEHPDSSLHPSTFACVPFTDTPPCRGGNWPAGYNFGGVGGPAMRLYLVPSVLERSNELNELKDEARLGEMLGEEEGEDGVKKLVDWWEENWPKMARDAKMLQAWQYQLDGSRSNNKRELRQERAKAIRKHLEEGGYDARDIDECIRNQNSEVYNLVDQPYPLSNRVWRKIQTPILAYITKVHQSRLEAEAQALAAQRAQLAREEAQRTLFSRLQQALLDRMRARIGAAAGPNGRGEGELEFGGGEAGRDAAQMLLDEQGFDGPGWGPREEQANFLVQQVAARAQANAIASGSSPGFLAADLQLLEVAVSLMPSSAGSGASAFALGGPLLPGAVRGDWF